MSETPKVIACYEESVAMKCAEQGCQCFQLERELAAEKRKSENAISCWQTELKRYHDALRELDAERAKRKQMEYAAIEAKDSLYACHEECEHLRARLKEVRAVHDAVAYVEERDLLHAEVAGLREALQDLMGLAEREGWTHVAINKARAALATQEEKC